MSTVALSGADSVLINSRILADLADGDAVTLAFPNEIASAKTGKNGNSIYGLNESGRQVDVSVRVLRGSPDDKFLNNLHVSQKNNFAGFVLMIGEFIKKIGDGDGNVISDTYILSGGIFTKEIDAKMNVEGESEQSVSVYTMKFTNAPRAIT